MCSSNVMSGESNGNNNNNNNNNGCWDRCVHWGELLVRNGSADSKRYQPKRDHSMMRSNHIANGKTKTNGHVLSKSNRFFSFKSFNFFSVLLIRLQKLLLRLSGACIKFSVIKKLNIRQNEDEIKLTTGFHG